MRYKGSNEETAKFLRRSERDTRIQVKHLEQKDKNRKIGPIGNKRFKIYRANIIQIDQKETQTKTHHDTKEIGNHQGGSG
jgi:O-phosphoseryl-tRNA(Cys) synthetase